LKSYFFHIVQLLVVFVLLGNTTKKASTKGMQGKASYYGREFEGRRTASGDRFRNADFTAAHRTLPFQTYVQVTNLKNKLSITVRVNDRGPFVKTRVIDLSEASARRIGSYQHGLASVKLKVMDLLHHSPELDSLFTCEDVNDCLGNPDQLKGISLSLWRTKDLIHLLYIANELYLHDDVEKVNIVGQGTGDDRIYHMVISGYSNAGKAKLAIDQFEKKGFMEVRFLQ
jgi:rare lipoprotein A